MKKLIVVAVGMLTLAPPAISQTFLPYGCNSYQSQAARFACDRNEGTYDPRRAERLKRRIYEADHPPTPQENAAWIRASDEMARRSRERQAREDARTNPQGHGATDDLVRMGLIPNR